MNALPFDKQIHIISALVDGCSIRTTGRLCHVHRDTIMRLGLSVGEACQRLHDQRMRGLHVTLLEVDELWSFLVKKQKRLGPKDPPELGDQYTYLALDAVKKAIVGFRTGKRTQETTDAFALDLRGRIVNRPQISSDGFQPYVRAVRAAFGEDVDYAMLVKDGPAPQKVPIIGNPDLAKVSTSFVERTNLSVRMQLRRFHRKTNGFSKKLRNHCAAVALFVAHYNFCRVHETLKTTPAVALGLADHVWSIAELMETALSIAPEIVAAAPEPEGPVAADPQPTPAPIPEAAQPPPEPLDAAPAAEPVPVAPEAPQVAQEGAQAAQELPAAQREDVGPESAPAPEEVARGPSALDVCLVETFEARFNKAARDWRVKAQLGEPVVLPHKKQHLRIYRPTDDISITLYGPLNSSRFRSLWVMDSDETRGRRRVLGSFELAEVMWLVIVVLTGPKTDQEEWRIRGELGLPWGRSFEGRWDGHVIVGDWDIALGKMKRTPISMLAALREPAAADKSPRSNPAPLS